jgi:hypothetical protein
MNTPALSVIVAVQHAQQNLPEIVRALNCPHHPEIEFLFCYADAAPDVPALLANDSPIRLVRGASGSLIPHLWRDGIVAARAEHVALTTAHCIPDDNWLDTLKRLDWDGLAGIGGVIENHPESSACDWAVYLLRYVSFAPPQAARCVEEIAADNAVYRRALIQQEADLLQQGFWEPSFHARFRAQGFGLALQPTLRVIHRNRYSAGEFFRQRFAHGRAFGIARASTLPLAKRLLLVALSPLLPFVFLRKIVVAGRQNPYTRSQLPRALPWLLFFLLGWGLGEARAYLESMVRL